MTAITLDTATRRQKAAILGALSRPPLPEGADPKKQPPHYVMFEGHTRKLVLSNPDGEELELELAGDPRVRLMARGSKPSKGVKPRADREWVQAEEIKLPGAGKATAVRLTSEGERQCFIARDLLASAVLTKPEWCA